MLRIGVQRGVWVGERADDLNNSAEKTVMSFAILPGKVEGVASQLMITDQWLLQELFGGWIGRRVEAKERRKIGIEYY